LFTVGALAQASPPHAASRRAARLDQKALVALLKARDA